MPLKTHSKYPLTMASADNNIAMPPIPALPSLVRIDSQRHGDDVSQLCFGQNVPPAAATTSADTTLTQRINVQISNQSSAISSLTTTDTSFVSANNSKQNRVDSSSYDDKEQLPKKALPDFSHRKSNNVSVVSGNNSEGWDEQEGRVSHDLCAQADAHEVRDNAIFLDVRMNEVNKWEVFAEGGADGDPPAPDVTNYASPQFDTVRVLYQKATAKVLVKIGRKVGITPSGSKRKVFDRLHSSENVLKVNEDSFEYCCKIVFGEKVPTWVILTPEPVPAVPGIDMATGAQRGYYGPTNKGNSTGGVRHNFITTDGKRIKRPLFEPKKVTKKSLIVNEHGRPSPAARKKIPSMKCARPKEFFDLQITPEFVKWLMNATNHPANAGGAGCDTLRSLRTGWLLMMLKSTGLLASPLHMALHQNRILITGLNRQKDFLCLGMTSFQESWQKRCT